MKKEDIEKLSNKEFVIYFLALLKSKSKTDFIPILTNGVKCNTLFDLAFPLLKLYNNKEEDQFYDETGSARYYTQNTFFEFHDKKYIICNHWFKNQRQYFEKWVNRNLEYPSFFLRKQFILFLINEENYTQGSANSYASYVSSAYNKLLKKHFDMNFFGLIEYCCKENISDEFEDLLDSSISFVLKNADEVNKKKYSYGLTEYKYFLKEIFDFPYDNEQYIPQYLSDKLKIEDELAANEKEDIIKFRKEIKNEYETKFEIDRDSLIANFRFRMITQDRLYGDIYFPIRLLKKIFYQNKKDKEFFDKFILDQIENIRIYNSSNKSFILLKNMETLSIDENNQVQCRASADWEDFSLVGNVFTELGEEGKYDLFKANNLREIAIDHIYTMKDVLLLHKSSLNGLVNLTNILKERGLVKSGKEAVKQLALIGNKIIDEEVLDDNDVQLLTNDLIFLGNKLHLQLMSSKENLKKKNR